jgi:putative transposase
MHRQSGLDVSGALHQVWGRGIEKVRIVQQESDREDFIARLAGLRRDGYILVLAWSLMPNHFSLLVRTGRQPILKGMKKFLPGYTVNFNRRHKRFLTARIASSIFASFAGILAISEIILPLHFSISFS